MKAVRNILKLDNIVNKKRGSEDSSLRMSKLSTKIDQSLIFNSHIENECTIREEKV